MWDIGLGLKSYQESEEFKEELIEYAEASYSAAFDMCKQRAQKLYPSLNFEGVEKDEEDNTRAETQIPAEPTARGEEDDDDTPEGDTPPELVAGGHGSDVEILQ